MKSKKRILMFLLVTLIVVEIPLGMIFKRKHDYYYSLYEKMGSKIYLSYSEMYFKLQIIFSIIIFFILFVVFLHSYLKLKHNVFTYKNFFAIVFSLTLVIGLLLANYYLPHISRIYILSNIASLAMVYLNINVFIKSI